MNFCPNCGKSVVREDDVSILCSCMEVGYCTKCGNQMKSGNKRKRNGQCETCTNAYTFIINCECFVDDITVKCSKCGVEPIPFTQDEYDVHRNYIYKKHKEVAARAGALRQKDVLLTRLVKNKNGKHCTCTANFTCGECYVFW